jgi:hypothetical protein
MTNPINQARQTYKTWTSDLLVEALQSSLTHLALGVTTIAGAYMLGAAVRVERPIPPLVATLTLATLAVGGATWVKGLDAQADWDAWKQLNSGDRRAATLDKLITGQAQGLSQLATLWVDRAKSDHKMFMAAQNPAPTIAAIATHQPPPTMLAPELTPAYIDIAKGLVNPIKSTFIVGQSGAGKGIAVAWATRNLKAARPDIQIWAIDPKADPSERIYWLACDRVLYRPLPAFASPGEVDFFCQAVDGFIAEFNKVQGPKLLIFDEALAVKESAPQWFRGISAGFNNLCSTGRSRDIFGWMISQTPNAADLGISGGARNVYRRVLLLSANDLGLIHNRSTFFSGQPTDRDLAETGRCAYDSLGNRWGAVPSYPALSEVAPVIEESQHDRLERAWAIAPVSILTSGEDAILTYIRERGAATTRKIQQAKLPALADEDSASIRALGDSLVRNELALWINGQLVPR